MTSLLDLYLDWTAIEELPSLIKHLTGLTLLIFKTAKTFGIFRGSFAEPINLLLPNLFSGLSSLVTLDLIDCNLSDGALPDDLSGLSSIQYLNLSKHIFTSLPDSISKLYELKLLLLDHCRELK